MENAMSIILYERSIKFPESKTPQALVHESNAWNRSNPFSSLGMIFVHEYFMVNALEDFQFRTHYIPIRPVGLQPLPNRFQC